MKRMFYLMCAVLLVCCSKQRTMTPAEMVQWTESPDNQLVRAKVLNGIEYRLQYMPAEYLALREQGTVKGVDEKQFAYRKGELEKYHHFRLRLSVPGVQTDPLLYGISDQQEYTARDMFYGFGFSEHIKKINVSQRESDTARCQLYQFVQHHGLAPYADVVFAFKKEKEEKEFQVVFDDPIFNNGLMKYTFTKEEINNLPQVKI